MKSNQFPHSPYLMFLWIGYLLDQFVSLDWGYSALSMFSSILSMLLFGLTVRGLTGSRAAGLIAGLVLAIAPVSIRFAGRQEVYPFQFLLLSLALYFGIRRRWALPCGLALGAAFSTHTGTLFAVPATLVLLSQSWKTLIPPSSAEESLLSKEPAKQSLPREFLDHLKQQPWKRWGMFAVGFVIPVVAVVGWLALIWLRVHGPDGLGLLFSYLRGSAPSPDFQCLFLGADANAGGLVSKLSIIRENLGDQLERIWEDLGNGEVLTRGLTVCGAIGLAAIPLRKSLAWWLFGLLYLLYEVGVGKTLDVGIYSVFILPALAFGLAHSAAQLVECRKRDLFSALRLAVLVGGLGAAGVNLANVQEMATYRSLQPWLREDGSTMALARFVRENTPPDTIVMVPVEWYYCGLAVPYYAERIPLFRNGYVLVPSPWQPIYSDVQSDYLRKISNEDIEKWLNEERPIVTFDRDPFTSFGSEWTYININPYEARPILWLDQNQTGTSLRWQSENVLCRIDPADRDDRKQWGLALPEAFPLPETEMPYCRPALYWIARKTDPLEPPGWVVALQEKVSPSQRGSLPTGKGHGYLLNETLSFQSPAILGKDHLVRLLINSYGPNYVVECEARSGGEWRSVGRDMEKYVVEPPPVFSELYFTIPGEMVDRDILRIRLSPSIKTAYINVYQIEVAVVEDKPKP